MRAAALYLLTGACAAQAESVAPLPPPAPPPVLQIEGQVRWSSAAHASGADAGRRIEATAVFAHPPLRLRLSLRRNTDPTLGVDEIAELRFVRAGRAIAKVYGLAVRTGDGDAALALDGLAVRVTDGDWLVGLADASDAPAGNLRLLAQARALDVPVALADGGKAMLILRKGREGEQVFAQALAEWKRRAAPAPTSAAAQSVVKPFQFPPEKILDLRMRPRKEFDGLAPYR